MQEQLGDGGCICIEMSVQVERAHFQVLNQPGRENVVIMTLR